jgi:hypothetical protein
MFNRLGSLGVRWQPSTGVIFAQVRGLKVIEPREQSILAQKNKTSVDALSHTSANLSSSPEQTFP